MRGDFMDAFLEMNNLLKKKLNKFIYIDSTSDEKKNSIHLLIKCIELGIYIKGFTTADKKLINSVILNKRVFDISLLCETDVVFSEFQDFKVNGYTVKKAFKFKLSNLLNKNIYIYGAGYYGQKALDLCIKNKLFVNGFIDSDIKKQGRYIQNVVVYSPEILKKNGEDSAIILAIAEYESVACFIKKYNSVSSMYYLNVDLLSEGTIKIGEKIITLFGMALHLCQLVYNKNVFIWRCGSSSDSFLDIYKLLDINIVGWLSEDENKIGGKVKGYPVFSIKDIIHESNNYVLIDSVLMDKGEIEKKCQELENLGLTYINDFQITHPVYSSNWYRRNSIIDINLGQSFKIFNNIPGMIHYGSKCQNSFTIVTLGNSTTEGQLYPFKCWVEFLCDKLSMDKVSIYNCGVSTYTTSQELIKFERDILNMHPNMVISLDGVNEAHTGETPFAFNYLNEIFDFVNKDVSYKRKYQEDSIFRGIPNQKDKVEIMIQNFEIINIICRNWGIVYHAFVQPNICSKQNRTPREEGILVSNEYMMSKEIMEYLYTYRSIITEKINDKLKNWLHDMSFVFDDVNEVYIDLCHVNEKGNKIIADEIWKIIERDIPDEYKK